MIPDSASRAKRSARAAILLAIACIVSPPAGAGVMDDSRIYYSHNDPETGFFSASATTFFDETYTPVDASPEFALNPFAQIVSGEIGVAFHALAHGGAFPLLSAAVRDTYVLSGTGTDQVPSQPGIQVSVPVSLHVEGEADRLDFPGWGQELGSLRVTGMIGHDLAPTSGLIVHSPVIQEVNGGKTVSLQAIPNGEGPFHADINFSVDTNVLVTIGEPFQLAYAVILQPIQGAHADLTNTATVDFDLPAGLSLSSQNGFGAGVPEPSSLVLVTVSVASLLVRRRRRRTIT